MLVHASGYSAVAWRPVAERLEAHCRALAPDLVGYGQTGPFEAERFEVADDAAVVAAVLDHVGAPVHLVGHSYGGVVALRVARARRADLLGLALLEPVAFGVLHAARDREGLADLGPLEGDPSTWADTAGGGRSGAWIEPFIDYWHGPGTWAAMAPSQREAILRFAPKVLLEVRDVSWDRAPASSWSLPGLPTLVLRGARTTVASRHVCERLAAAFPEARLEEVEGAGHFLPMTHPDAVAARLLAHFRRAERR